MKILAIEASGPVAGCAVLEDGVLIADYNVQYKKKHAQSLVPMMDEVKRMLELDLQSVDAHKRTGFFYRSADRGGDGKGSGPCHGQTHHSGAHSGFHRL